MGIIYQLVSYTEAVHSTGKGQKFCWQKWDVRHTLFFDHTVGDTYHTNGNNACIYISKQEFQLQTTDVNVPCYWRDGACPFIHFSRHYYQHFLNVTINTYMVSSGWMKGILISDYCIPSVEYRLASIHRMVFAMISLSSTVQTFHIAASKLIACPSSSCNPKLCTRYSKVNLTTNSIRLTSIGFLANIHKLRSKFHQSTEPSSTNLLPSN